MEVHLMCFLDDSINQSKIISITLKNDKVYIGKLTKIYSPIGAEDKYITLLPIFSGYRHSDTRTLELTTSYLSIFEKISEKDEALGELTIDDFQIIISVCHRGTKFSSLSSLVQSFHGCGIVCR